MKENKIEELKERLEELHRIQEARLACSADDLDIREEIAEVEEEIKELEDDINEENNNGNDTNVGSIGNSIEDIARIAKLITTKFNNDYSIDNKDKEAIEHILSDYKRVLKENEEQKACIHILDNELKEINEKRKKQEIKIQELQKENEELKESKITYEKVRDIQEKNRNIVDNKYIPKQKIKDIIDRIDYDIEKTKEIISKNTSVYATYRKNDYQIVRLRAMNTKSLDIKKLLESEK